MNRSYRVVRASFYLSVALPLTVLACGQAFESAGGDAGEGDAQGIILGDGGGGRDATKDGATDSGADVRHDGPGDGGERDGTRPDGEGTPETGGEGSVPEGGLDVVTAETGGGCPTGWLTCSDGGCAQESATNCGACGNDCTTLPNVVNASCTSGQCTYTCAQGWGHCTTNPNDGCDTNTTTPQNCGMCGVTCSNPTPVCAAGTGCVSGCPPTKPTLCNGTTCVDTTSDPQNCNACNNVCPAGPANSQPTCTSSTCGWSCNSNYSQCGSSCFDENTDTNHCGSCNTVCPGATNGQAECNDGGCTVACNTGLTYCPPSCVDTTSDPNNCSGCGKACSTSVQYAHPICTSSMCSFACDTDYKQCGSICVRSVPVATGYFVAPGGSNTAGCGSASNPCGSISTVLAFQPNTPVQDIYVATGTYTEQVTLPAGVAIHGGWDYQAGAWSYPCTANPDQTVIQAPAGSDRVIIADFNGSSAMDMLKIANATTAATGTSTTPGQSLYGVFAASAQSGQTVLTLTNVDITVNAGGMGNTGGQGLAGNGPPPSCSSGDGADAGASTSVGPGASNGVYDVSGFHPAVGNPGPIGPSGDNGSAAPAAPCVNLYPGTTTSNANCCNVINVGCSACSGSPTDPLCGHAGTNGCGSFGGGGGYGGTGGGASLGVFAWNVAVTLDNVNISAGAGGQGGNGGPGGLAQSGSAGAAGAHSDTQYSPSCTNTMCTSSCFCLLQNTHYVPGGAAGGTGGTGGQGGQGGGGAGGDSFCYYQSSPNLVTVSGGGGCTAAGGGPGGNNGAAAGRTGHN